MQVGAIKKIEVKTTWNNIIVESNMKAFFCKWCKKRIVRGKTILGKSMHISQLESGEYVSHFMDCNKSSDFRK